MAGSLVAPIAGAAIGGLMGGRDQTSTSTTKPYLPENYAEGYDLLLEDAKGLYQRPFRRLPTARVETNPETAFDRLFANPEMMEIQKQEDQKFYQKALQPQEPSKDAELAEMDALRREMMARDFVNNARSQYMPGTQQAQMYQQNFDYNALGDLLNKAQERAGGSQIRDMDYLNRIAMNDPELSELYMKAMKGGVNG